MDAGRHGAHPRVVAGQAAVAAGPGEAAIGPRPRDRRRAEALPRRVGRRAIALLEAAGAAESPAG